MYSHIVTTTVFYPDTKRIDHYGKTRLENWSQADASVYRACPSVVVSPVYNFSAIANS